MINNLLVTLPEGIRAPVEIWQHIISFLPLLEQTKLALVCRFFETITYKNCLLQKKVHQRGHNFSSMELMLSGGFYAPNKLDEFLGLLNIRYNNTLSPIEKFKQLKQNLDIPSVTIHEKLSEEEFAEISTEIKEKLHDKNPTLLHDLAILSMQEAMNNFNDREDLRSDDGSFYIRQSEHDKQHFSNFIMAIIYAYHAQHISAGERLTKLTVMFFDSASTRETALALLKQYCQSAFRAYERRDDKRLKDESGRDDTTWKAYVNLHESNTAKTVSNLVSLLESPLLIREEDPFDVKPKELIPLASKGVYTQSFLNYCSDIRQFLNKSSNLNERIEAIWKDIINSLASAPSKEGKIFMEKTKTDEDRLLLQQFCEKHDSLIRSYPPKDKYTRLSKIDFYFFNALPPNITMKDLASLKKWFIKLIFQNRQVSFRNWELKELTSATKNNTMMHIDHIFNNHGKSEIISILSLFQGRKKEMDPVYKVIKKNQAYPHYGHYFYEGIIKVFPTPDALIYLNKQQAFPEYEEDSGGRSHLASLTLLDVLCHSKVLMEWLLIDCFTVEALSNRVVAYRHHILPKLLSHKSSEVDGLLFIVTAIELVCMILIRHNNTNSMFDILIEQPEKAQEILEMFDTLIKEQGLVGREGGIQAYIEQHKNNLFDNLPIVESPSPGKHTSESCRLFPPPEQSKRSRDDSPLENDSEAPFNKKSKR